MDKTFELGDVVFERVRPNQKLIIIQRSGKIYYCVPQENKKQKALVIQERDLRSNSE